MSIDSLVMNLLELLKLSKYSSLKFQINVAFNFF